MFSARFFVFAIALASAIASASPIDVAQRDSDELQDLFVRAHKPKAKTAPKSRTPKPKAILVDAASAMAAKRAEARYKQQIAAAQDGIRRVKGLASQASFASGYAASESPNIAKVMKVLQRDYLHLA